MARLTEEMLAPSGGENQELSGRVPPLLNGKYVLRIINTSNEPSKRSGNRMVTLEMEIVSPERVIRNGVKYVVSGLKAKCYFPIESKKGLDVTKELQRAYKDFRAMMGVEPYFDLQNPEHEDLRGLGFKAVLGSEERIPMVRNEEGEEEQLKDEVTGQPISRGWQIGMINSRDILSKVDLDTVA
jgi:hypothetical protein